MPEEIELAEVEWAVEEGHVEAGLNIDDINLDELVGLGEEGFPAHLVEAAHLV